MEKFAFYLDSDGNRPVANNDGSPNEIIRADGLLGAIALFSAENKRHKAESEALENGTYRGYFYKKRFFQKD
ncbi:hypothetical protein [Sporolactobacillus terrae]|uniref:hypothetical protein n=1 Tax=Sporolactobacillus terrae TaxID=269673 RepID=UPI001117B39A|nr:hypothetical protein [Sporolactobacillus terrae]